MRAYLDLIRRNRDFRRVFAAELISLGGDWFAVIPLITLLPVLTGTGLWGGLVLAVDTAVVALLAPYAGTIADRVDRRTILIVSNLASAGSVLLLLFVRSAATAWVALVAVGAVAISKAFYVPASQAALPNLVDPVGDRAGVRGEQRQHRRVDGEHQPAPQARTGEHREQGEQRDDREPVATQRDQLGRERPPKVRIATDQVQVRAHAR